MAAVAGLAVAGWVVLSTLAGPSKAEVAAGAQGDAGGTRRAAPSARPATGPATTPSAGPATGAAAAPSRPSTRTAGHAGRVAGALGRAVDPALGRPLPGSLNGQVDRSLNGSLDRSLDRRLAKTLPRSPLRRTTAPGRLLRAEPAPVTGLASGAAERAGTALTPAAHGARRAGTTLAEKTALVEKAALAEKAALVEKTALAEKGALVEKAAPREAHAFEGPFRLAPRAARHTARHTARKADQAAERAAALHAGSGIGQAVPDARRYDLGHGRMAMSPGPRLKDAADRGCRACSSGTGSPAAPGPFLAPRQDEPHGALPQTGNGHGPGPMAAAPASFACTAPAAAGSVRTPPEAPLQDQSSPAGPIVVPD
ncbi:hypothetical protein ACFY4C_38310 [Actinomadura viridis]|uniref:hypothetical protein n=1 Tax=Actinomadura viridis TaxID=58110 RepID=UPI00367A23C3